MVINTNLSANSAANNLQTAQAQLSKSLARLSSGNKIVNPGDDAGGLAAVHKLDSTVQRISAAKSNVANAMSFTQTQEGYMKKVANALDRMSELAILAQDVTKSETDRGLYNNEFTQLATFITEAAGKQFNGVSLFSPASMNVAIDADGGAFTMNGINLGASIYSAATSASIDTASNASSALNDLKTAIDKLSQERAQVGAYQSRLHYTDDQLTITKENLSAASSRIQDVNVAEESTQFARNNILLQTTTAMLAQANQLPQNVLRLLQ